MSGPIEYINVPNLIIHPFEHVKAKKIFNLQKSSIPQEELFFNLRKQMQISLQDYLNKAPFRDYWLLMFGYDADFMNRDDTLDTIRNGLSQDNISTYLSKKPVQIIVSKKDDISKLEELSKDNDKISILKASYDIPNGNIVYGTRAASSWDTTNKTYYPPEQDKFIFRELSFSEFRIKLSSDMFNYQAEFIR